MAKLFPIERRTGCEHALDEVDDVAENDAKTLRCTWLASYGLDLNTLQYRLHIVAIQVVRVENGTVKYMSNETSFQPRR